METPTKGGKKKRAARAADVQGSLGIRVSPRVDEPMHPGGCPCGPCAELNREAARLAEDAGTRCGYADFNTCRAQHCGGYAPALSGPPFCTDCMALLPEVTRRRLVDEWARRPMMPITEAVIVERLFTIPPSQRRSKGRTYLQEIGEERTRDVVDMNALVAQMRRLEVQTAWTLRAIRRRQAA